MVRAEDPAGLTTRIAGMLHRPVSLSLIVMVIGGVTVVGLNGNYDGSIVVLALGYAVVTTGMSVQIGYSHQLAFSQSLFVGFGAYGAAVLNAKYGVPMLVSLVILLLGSAVLATLIGSLVTRAPGLALAVATLLFPLILTGYVTFSSYLGQTTGLGGIQPLWGGSTFQATLVRSGFVALLLLALAVFVCGRLLNSGVGLELALVGEGEHIAASLGIMTRRRKLEVFVFGCVLSCLGGIIYAGTQAFVSPDIFSAPTELTLLVMLFVGGRRSIAGAIVGALAIEFLTGSSTFVSTHLLLIEGVVLTVVLLFEPEGLAQITLRVSRFLLHRSPTSARPMVADPVAVTVGPATAPRLPTVTPPALHGAAASAAERSGPVLACVGLTRSFGGVVAVDNVSLEIPGIGLYGLCGPNGAGKSTLFNLIGGSIPPENGQVLFLGSDIAKADSARRANLGIARTFQAAHLMPDQTALDNVAVACLPSHETFMARTMFRRDLKDARERAREVLASIGVGHLAPVLAGQLTLEGQRMVELARALSSAPTVLLLDEPASGLSVDQRRRLAEILGEIATKTTIVLVEHDLSLLSDLAEKLFMLVDGKLEFEGEREAFKKSPVVRSVLMGLID